MNAIIAWMVRNGVAANLLMAFLIFAGLVSFFSVKQTVLPEVTLDNIQVRVAYPGALPDEVEEAIVEPIEDQVEGIEGIREVRATASEGIGVVTIEFLGGSEMPVKLDEVKSEVDRITSFPEDAEEPEVTILSNRARIIEIALYGDVAKRTLKQVAEQTKDDLSALPNISFVDVRGAEPYEVSIEISRDALRAYGLSLTEVASRVRQNSLDLSAGDIETSAEQILVRTKGRSYTALDFEQIVLIGDEGGAQVRLKDVATVIDGFEDTDGYILYQDQPAVFVRVFRIGEERVLDVVASVESYFNETLTPSLPAGVQADIWRNDADEFKNRLELLIRNGALGLLLVITALTLFLNLRLAFWVSLGIFISFVGAFGVMAVFGVSINQLSLFGFVLAIGIVVDDAIVVGENIYAERQRGGDPQAAAITGAQRIHSPVIFAVTTTVVVFFPLLFLPGELGKFLQPIPIIVITVLVLSLVEALLVLPRHLSHVWKAPVAGASPGILSRLQEGVDRGLQSFVNGPFDRALHFATRHYGVVIAAGASAVLLSFGLVGGGFVSFGFAPRVEANYVTATIELTPGAAEERTYDVANGILNDGRRLADNLRDEFGMEPGEWSMTEYMSIGLGSGISSGPGGEGLSLTQANKATIVLDLGQPENRPFSSKQFEQRWRRAVGEIPDVRKMVFSSSFINLGQPVQVELSAADNDALTLAVDRLQTELRQLNGVFDVTSDQEQGRRELTLVLRPEARTFGLTLEDVARQVRAAFFGAEALRVQRDGEEVRVYVRLPENERSGVADLLDYRIRTESGAFVPVSEVAEITEGEGSTTINRYNGKRIVSVSADVQVPVTTGQDVRLYLDGDFLPKLVNEIPGLSYAFGGEQRTQSEFASVLPRNFAIAMFVIYTLLAIAFRSYTQPLIVLSAVPFGFMGAIVGHFLLGVTMTMISIFGIIGLSGVIINGSLVLIDFVNERLAQGVPAREAIIEATKVRFRPIILTSLTTFLGTFPLIVEPSVQAQFLIPMAVSVGFGVLLGTPVLLLIVPAITALHASVFLRQRV